MLEVIERNANRELRLVNDLLDLSSIDVTTVEEHQRVCLGSLARSTAEGARVTALSKKIEVAVQVPPGLYLDGDPQRLAQVVDNLVANAVKFSPDPTPVTVRARSVGQLVEVLVEDCGIGIPAAELAGVTQRFARASNAVERQIQGAGLGLGLAQTVVVGHGGSLALESTEGVGTRVRLLLPAGAGATE